MTDLKEETALITGSTSGIGRATAVALAVRGAHVLIVGHDEQRAKDADGEIEGSGGSAAFRLTMLSDLESAHDPVEWATGAGDGHGDILINNAGVALLGPSMAVHRGRVRRDLSTSHVTQGGDVVAGGNWEVLHGDSSLTSGALVRFTDRETALRWYKSPEYQQLTEVRGVAMEARFRLLDGLSTSTEGERESM